MKWISTLLVALALLVMAGLLVKTIRRSQVVGYTQYRFNLAWIIPDSGVTFVSYDPVEREVLVISFPTDLAITSRNSGEYSIASLYKLGSYEGQGGAFARQKIQGFMRVPVPGYIVAPGSLTQGLLSIVFGSTESSLSRLDALLLLYRTGSYSTREVGKAELVRAGVVEDTTYHADRLQEYVGARLFDWGIAGEAVRVAVINESGEDGLGSDMADFLTNLGLDVVMVKSGSGPVLDTSVWQVDDEKRADALRHIFEGLFGFDSPKLETVGTEYRSDVLVRVGRDAQALF